MLAITVALVIRLCNSNSCVDVFTDNVSVSTLESRNHDIGSVASAFTLSSIDAQAYPI
jgi:hypothetical protein